MRMERNTRVEAAMSENSNDPTDFDRKRKVGKSF